MTTKICHREFKLPSSLQFVIPEIKNDKIFPISVSILKDTRKNPAKNFIPGSSLYWPLNEPYKQFFTSTLGLIRYVFL